MFGHRYQPKNVSRKGRTTWDEIWQKNCWNYIITSNDVPFQYNMCVFQEKGLLLLQSSPWRKAQRPENERTNEGDFWSSNLSGLKAHILPRFARINFSQFFYTLWRICQQIESKQHNILKRKMGVGENKQSHKNHNFFLQFCRRSQLGSFIADFLPSSINKQFKAKILGPMGSRKKKKQTTDTRAYFTKSILSYDKCSRDSRLYASRSFKVFEEKSFLSGPLELKRSRSWHLLIKIRAGNSRLSYPFQLLFKPFVFLKWSLLYQVFLKGLPSAGALLKKLTTCFLSIFHHRWIHWCQKWVTQVAPPSFLDFWLRLPQENFFPS